MIPTMAVSALRQVCIGSYCTVIPHQRNSYRPYALRHPVLAFCSTFLIVTKIATVGIFLLTPNVASLATITSTFLVEKTNEARRAAGVPPLTVHPLLAASARLKAEDMLRADYFEHTSPTGVTPWQWFDRAGYAYVYAGENLAIDFTTGEATQAAWMNSSGHRRNILGSSYANIGIAVVTGEFEGRTTTVVVQHFGALSNVQRGAPMSTTTSPTPSTTPLERSTRPTALPALAPPTILEPSEGKILPSGASTVRGNAAAGSVVQVTLDGTSLGKFAAPNGAFQGSFEPPAGEERDAILTATTTLGNRRSPPSQPRHVRLDTRPPLIAEDRALLLPPRAPGEESATLLLPLPADARKALVVVNGKTIPLELRGRVAHAAVDMQDAWSPIVIKAADAYGNTRTVTVQPLHQFLTIPLLSGEADTRARLLDAARGLREFSAILLVILAALCALNILIHVRIQHADLIMHTFFVLGLGALLLVS